MRKWLSRIYTEDKKTWPVFWGIILNKTECLFVCFVLFSVFVFVLFFPQWYYTDCEGREAEVAKEPTSIYSVTSATLLFNKQRSNEWIDSQKNHRRSNIIQCMQCMQQYFLVVWNTMYQKGILSMIRLTDHNKQV